MQEPQSQKAKLFEWLLILALFSIVYKPFVVWLGEKKVETSQEDFSVNAIKVYGAERPQGPCSLVMYSLLINTPSFQGHVASLFFFFMRQNF